MFPAISIVNSMYVNCLQSTYAYQETAFEEVDKVF